MIPGFVGSEAGEGTVRPEGGFYGFQEIIKW